MVRMTSRACCPFCGSSELRYVAVGEGRFNAECRLCMRVVEERKNTVKEILVERAHDAPLCIVTPDFNENDAYKAPPIDDDPFESIGFITAFSTWSLERSPLYAVTTSTMSGQLAEMERTLSDTLFNGGNAGPVSVSGASSNTLDILRGYMEVLEVSSILGLERDICDHAYDLFRDCLQQTYLRNRNIEALAIAAIIQAMREANEPRTLQEVSQASAIPQKEIGRHMKILSDALKLSQPMNSNSISSHMPRFCGILQLSQNTQKLATHIGEVVLDKSFCTRRNPISISAAAIYLACHLEDKRKTQTEICKATGLTEVTLRKVYKELLENLDDLLPSDYTPAVPLEKAFSVNTASSLRVHVQRQAAGISGLSDPSITTTPYNSAVSNNSVGLAGDTSSAVGGSGASSPAQPNMVRVPVSAASANERATAVPYPGSALPADARAAGMHIFAVPNQVTGVSNGVESLESNRQDAPKETERERTDREKDRDRERSEPEYGGLKKVNMMPPANVAGFNPATLTQRHFFPFHVDPRVLHEMWPLQLYGTAAMRPEDPAATAARGSDRSREDGLPGAAQPNLKGHPQYVGVFPGMAENLNPSMQMKMLQLMQSRPTDTGERQAAYDRERDADRDRDHETAEPAESGSHNGPNPPANSSASTISVFAASAAAAAASAGRGPVYPGFPPGLWPFMSNNGGTGPYGLFPPQLIPGGGMPQAMVQGMSQGGENHSGGADKTVGNNMVLDGLPHGLLASAGAEALARMAPGVVPGQPGLAHGLLASAGAADVLARMGPGVVQGQAGGLGAQSNVMWPGAQFHQLFLPQGMIPGPLPTPCSSNGPSDVLNGIKRDNVGSNLEGNVRSSTAGPNIHLAQRSVTDLFPMLGMTGNHGVVQGPPGHPPSNSNRTDNGDTTANSAATGNQTTYERQLPHGQH
ncbi:hypothetical protein AXG93_1913s1450 [Marchantia polymorpha subsp. ruderalis]|uniref:Cyclin-like domain-containing protein n=1 Tax=Marchantia polymorpha subsp. ruderalis TaxID=1480154 RepID=A0A176WK70_MARPO|nr:hypothetical protein AXG93_1913s1450 [Marchantia polymorpha subsp. ruderalis]